MQWGTGITFVPCSQVKQHAKAGRFDEVEAELRALDPAFATNHPKATPLPRRSRGNASLGQSFRTVCCKAR